MFPYIAGRATPAEDTGLFFSFPMRVILRILASSIPDCIVKKVGISKSRRALCFGSSVCGDVMLGDISTAVKRAEFKASPP